MRRFRCAALVAVVCFASALVGNSNALMAQTADRGAKTDRELAKENAALRNRIHRLELERQNAKLHHHVRRLETKKGPAVAPARTNVANARASTSVARASASVARRSASDAYASDMPVKASVYNAPAANNWSGWYVGGEVGGKWVTNNWNTTCVQGGGLFTCGTAANAIIFPGAPDSSAANAFKTSGLRTGVYIGAMSQVNANWVVGMEGDAAYYSQSSTVGAFWAAARSLAPTMRD
jgi:hypothetical protein